MKKLLQKWLGLSTQDNPAAINNLEENFISFVVDKYQRPIIRINLQNLDELSARKFAELLFVLNKGGNEQQTIDMLLELGDNDPSRKSFVQIVLQNWETYLGHYNNYNSDNTPCVSPLNFSKLFIQQHTATNDKQK